MSAEAYQKILARKRRELRARADEIRHTFASLSLNQIIREVTATQEEYEYLFRSRYR